MAACAIAVNPGSLVHGLRTDSTGWGAARVMIQIDFNSAKMAVDAQGAVPAVAVGRRWASVHLTRGFVSPDTEPTRNKPAFQITGEVDVLVDTQSEVDDIVNGKWIFNFVQLCRVNLFETTWTGRTRNEGEISFIQSEPPAFPANRRVSLDANSSSSPFVNSDLPAATVSRRPGPKIKVHVVAKMGDHPNARQLVTPVQNSVTRSPNFLIQLEDDNDFFTVFMARNNGGSLQPPLTHIHWRLAYDARFKWVQRKARGELRSPILQFDPFVQGGPADAAVQALLSNPAPPHTKDLLDEAGRKGLLTHLNLQQSAKRSLLVPKDFFI